MIELRTKIQGGKFLAQVNHEQNARQFGHAPSDVILFGAVPVFGLLPSPSP